MRVSSQGVFAARTTVHNFGNHFDGRLSAELSIRQVYAATMQVVRLCLFFDKRFVQI